MKDKIQLNAIEPKQQTTAQAMVYEDLLRKYESLAQQNAAMREALVNARVSINHLKEIDYGTYCDNPSSLEEIDQALSPDAGRDYVAKEMAVEAVQQEPELPGPMPDDLWLSISNNRDSATGILREVVIATKRNIIERIKAL